LIAIRAAACTSAAARLSRLAVQIASEPRSVRWISQACLSRASTSRNCWSVRTFPAIAGAAAGASLQETLWLPD